MILPEQIAINTFYTTDYQPLADIVLPNFKNYCQKWGYQLITTVAPYGNPNRYYGFQSIERLRDLLFKETNDIKLVLHLALNSFIMNFNMQIESFVGDADFDFFITKDNNGKYLNAGSFIIRKSVWANRWLDMILSHDSSTHCWGEQQVMIENEHNPEFKDKIKEIPQETINSYFYENYGIVSSGQFKKGTSFILRSPGRSILADPNDSLMESRIKFFMSEKVQSNIIV